MPSTFAKYEWAIVSSAAAALGVGAIALIYWVPYLWVKLVIVGFLVIALLVYSLNPATRYRRGWQAALVGLIGANSIPSVLLFIEMNEGSNVGLSIDAAATATFNIAIALVLIGLAIADFVSTYPDAVNSLLPRHIRIGTSARTTAVRGSNASTIVGSHNVVNQSSGPSTEELRVLALNTAEATAAVADRSHAIEADIDAAKDFLAQNKPELAIALLERLLVHNVGLLSDRLSFRLHANLGIAYQSTCNYIKAAEHFLKAKTAQPSLDRAQALGVAAEYASGAKDKAWDLARSAIAQHPDSAEAWSVWARTAPPDMTLAELEELVPSPLRQSKPVCYGLAWAAYERGEFERAQSMAEPFVPEVLNELEFAEIFALSVLKRGVTVASTGRRSAATDSSRHDLTRAEAILSKLIAATAAHNPSAAARHYFHRGMTKFFRQAWIAAEADFRLAVELDLDHLEARRLLALASLKRGDESAAIETLTEAVRLPKALNSESERSVVLLYLARLLVERGHCDDLVQAKTIVSSDELLSVDGASAIERLDIFLSACATLGESEAVVSAINVARENGLITKAVGHALLCRLATKLRQADKAVEHASRAYESTSLESPSIELAFIAMTLEEARQFPAALALWKKVVCPTWYGDETKRALLCAFEASDEEFILEFCRSLRKEGLASDVSIEAEAIVLDKYGDLTTAIDVVSAYLPTIPESRFSRTLRLRLSTLAARAGIPEHVTYNVTRLPSVEESSPHLGAITAQHLFNGPNPVEGVQHLYAVVRRHFNSAEAQQLLASMALELGQKDVVIPERANVSPGDAVRFKQEGSTAEEWIFLEPENADPARQEIGPSSSLWQRLLGRGVGDSFALRDDAAQPRTGVIDLVVPSYFGRGIEAAQNWERRFPDDEFVRSYDLTPREGTEPNLEVFFEVLRQREEGLECLFDLYRESPVSIASVSLRLGVPVVQSTIQFAHRPDFPLRCCHGSPEDFSTAEKLLGRQQLSFVLDAPALSTLYITGLFRIVGRQHLSMSVPKAVLDEFRTLFRGRPSKSELRVGMHGGRPFVTELSSEELQSEALHNHEFIEWAESNCDIVPGTALAYVEPSKRGLLIELFGQPCAEAIATAWRSGALLWTDDLVIAEIAREQLGVSRVWTQAIAEQLTRSQTMSEDEFREHSLALIDAGYTFTRSNPDVIVLSARKSDWNPERRPLKSAIRWIQISGVTPQGAIAIVLATLPKIWRAAPLIQQREQIVQRLAHELAGCSRGDELLAVAISRVVDAFGGEDASALQCRAVLQGVRDARAKKLILPVLEGRSHRASSEGPDEQALPND